MIALHSWQYMSYSAALPSWVVELLEFHNIEYARKHSSKAFSTQLNLQLSRYRHTYILLRDAAKIYNYHINVMCPHYEQWLHSVTKIVRQRTYASTKISDRTLQTKITCYKYIKMAKNIHKLVTFLTKSCLVVWCQLPLWERFLKKFSNIFNFKDSKKEAAIDV